MQRTPVRNRPAEDLTPREREVLALIAEGRTNAEIADVMRITWYTARNHVTNILKKLDVQSREEAAAWWRAHGGAAPVRDRAPSRRGIRGLLGLGSLEIIGSAGAALAVGAVGLAVAVLAIVAWPNDGEEEIPVVADVTPTATAALEPTEPPLATFTPTATATTPPLPIDVPVREVTEGAPIAMDNLAVLIAEGCWGCDAPTRALVRMYRDPAGELRRDVLFEANDTMAPYINGYDSRAEMSHIIVTVCTVGGCGGVSGPTDDAAVTVYESRDGGITWDEMASLDFDASFFFAPDGTYRFSRWHTVDDARGRQWSQDIYEYPSMGFVENVQWASLARTELRLSDDRHSLLRTDGSEFYRLPDDRLILGNIYSQSDTVLVEIGWGDPPAGGVRYLALVRDDVVENAYQLSSFAGNGINLWFHGWLDDTTMLANSVNGPSLPALFDTETGAYHLLEGAWDPDGPASNRNYLRAAIEGPFARVVSGEECLNVREAPGTVAGVLGCYADGVLLRTDLAEQEADGLSWLSVLTPSGEAGWAAAEFLEY